MNNILLYGYIACGIFISGKIEKKMKFSTKDILYQSQSGKQELNV